MFHAGIADDEDCLGRKFFSMFRGFCVFCPLNIVRGIAGIAQTSDELVEQIEIIKERPACFHIGILAAQRASVIKKILRSEEHTSELQSLMRISYAVFCLKKKNTKR